MKKLRRHMLVIFRMFHPLCGTKFEIAFVNQFQLRFSRDLFPQTTRWSGPLQLVVKIPQN